LEAAVGALEVAAPDRVALVEVARSPDGFLIGEAPFAVAQAIGEAYNESNARLVALVGAGFLTVIDTPTGDRRVTANYAQLGVAAELQTQLGVAVQEVSSLGPPQSPAAVGMLADWLASETDHLYLVTELSPPAAFPDLNARCERGRRTTVILPKKAHVASDNRDLYVEVIKQWRAYSSATEARKKHLRVHLARTRCAPLYSSALCQSAARVNLYSYDAPAGRSGVLVVATKESSLYDLAATDYRDVLRLSAPLFRLWPLDWLKAKTGTAVAVAGAIVAAIALASFTGAIGSLVAGAFIGVVGQNVVTHLALPLWSPTKLFVSD
jgi:hypothetical protein